MTDLSELWLAYQESRLNPAANPLRRTEDWLQVWLHGRLVFACPRTEEAEHQVGLLRLPVEEDRLLACESCGVATWAEDGSWCPSCLQEKLRL